MIKFPTFIVLALLIFFGLFGCATITHSPLEKQRAISSQESIDQIIAQLEGDYNKSRQAYHALVKIGTPAIPKLIEALNSEKEEIQTNAAMILGEIGDRSVESHLLALLQDKNPEVRFASGYGLAKLGNEKGIFTLIQLLHCEKDVIRWKAASVLGKVRDRRAVPELIEALDDRDGGIRAMAAESLGMIGDERALDGLVEMLDDPHITYTRCQLLEEERVMATWNEANSDFAAQSIQQITKQPFGFHMTSLSFEKDRAKQRIRSWWKENKHKFGIVKGERELKEIDDLIKKLGSRDWALSVKAKENIKTIGQSVIPYLIKALLKNEENIRVHWGIINILGELGDKSVVPILTKKLEDENYYTRHLVAEALGKLGDNSAIPFLIETLEDEHRLVRGSATIALGKFDGKKSIDALIKTLLEDKEELVREDAAQSLGDLRNTSAIPSLIKALKDKDSSVRMHVAEALGKLECRAAVFALIEALNDKDEIVRSYVIWALEDIGDKSATSSLIKVLRESKDAETRSRAAWALKNLKDKSAVSTLIEALGDKELEVRCEAAEALGKIGDKSAVPTLIKALEDEELRDYSVTALGEIGDKRAVEYLTKLLVDNGDPWDCQLTVVLALGKLGDRSMIPYFIKRLNNEDARVRSFAACALDILGDPSSAPMLLERLENDNNPYVRAEAAQALGKFRYKASISALKNGLKDKDDYVRRSCAESLGMLGDKSAIPHLIGMLKDADIEVQSNVAIALTRLKDKTSVLFLLTNLKANEFYLRRDAAIGLGELGDISNAQVLIKVMMEDKDHTVRRSAAEALSKLEDKSVISSLIEALDDGDDWVREGVVLSLRNLTGQFFNFDPYAPREDREEAMRKWQEWWEKNKDTFKIGEEEKYSWSGSPVAMRYQATPVVSPDGKWEVQTDDISKDWDYQLILRDRTTGKEQSIYTFGRGIDVLWSPTGKSLLINDRAVSNLTYCYIYDVSVSKLRCIDEPARQVFESDATAEAQYDHVYASGEAWSPDEKFVLLGICGHGKTPLKKSETYVIKATNGEVVKCISNRSDLLKRSQKICDNDIKPGKELC